MHELGGRLYRGIDFTLAADQIHNTFRDNNIASSVYMYKIKRKERKIINKGKNPHIASSIPASSSTFTPNGFNNLLSAYNSPWNPASRARADKPLGAHRTP